MNANQYNNSMYTTCSNFQEDIMDPSEAVCFDPIEELILNYGEDNTVDIDEPLEEELAAKYASVGVQFMTADEILAFAKAGDLAYTGGVVDE